MKKNILIGIVCTIAAFGLNGCASDDAPEKSEERNTEGISFEIPAEGQAAPAKASRTGGVKLSDRLKFVWSETDFNYLWCDVNQQEATANWQKPTMQYTLSRDNANPAQLTSVSFVYQQLMPLVKRQNDENFRGKAPGRATNAEKGAVAGKRGVGAVEAADLPVAEGDLREPGENGKGEQGCGGGIHGGF